MAQPSQPAPSPATVDSQSPPQSHRWCRWLGLLGIAAVLPLLLLAHCFFATSTGSMAALLSPAGSYYYDALAAGFAQGQLNVTIEPLPELLAKADPFAHEHAQLWAWDMSLYKGKYYIYWGPVPALFLALFKFLLGPERAFTDGLLAVAALYGRMFFALLILLELRRSLMPKLPMALLLLAWVLVTLTGPLPFFLGRLGVYEAAIAAGQCFLFGGLWTSLCVWTRPRHASYYLGATGVMWALAMASRISLLPATAVLCALLVALLIRQQGLGRRTLYRAAVLSAPLAVGGLLLAVYNQLRFDSPLEFGVTHQLTTIDFDPSFRFVFHNLYSYFLLPPLLRCQFPWLHMPFLTPPSIMPAWMGMPAGYTTDESTVGLLILAPWVLVAVLPVYAIFKYGNIKAVLERRVSPATVVTLYFVASTLVAAFAGIAPALRMRFATMRYLVDVASPLSLCAALGLFMLWQRWPRHWPKALRLALLCAMSAVSLGISTLFGMQGYYDAFLHRNPELSQRLVHQLSICDDES